jgi:predicted nucleotidyltransferase
MTTPALRDQDLAVLRRTFRRFPCVREVRLFGSRATGHARRSSDIDLAISAPDATADQWLELADALDEAPIIYEFDLVRIDRAHNPRLIEKVAREGLAIYPEKLSGPEDFPGLVG